MAAVFLSYARPDADAAVRVARKLGKAGFSVWYDRELPAHRAYADVIASELESAAAVLVLWSKASAESQWVRSEANRARELNKLVQARVGDGRLPMPFDQIQCADLTKWRSGSSHAGWLQVRSSIDALVGGDPSAERGIGPTTHPDASRRRVLVATGAAVIAGTAGAGFWLRRPETDHPNPEVALLLQKGIDTLQMEDVFALENPGNLRNAIALLTEATQADPRSSNAWGALALAFAALKRVSGPVARPGLDQRSRSAASSALTLDAHEPRATAALLLLNPLYGHWAAAEHADRRALTSTHGASRFYSSFCLKCCRAPVAARRRQPFPTTSTGRRLLSRAPTNGFCWAYGRRAICREPTRRFDLRSSTGRNIPRFGERGSHT